MSGAATPDSGATTPDTGAGAKADLPAEKEQRSKLVYLLPVAVFLIIGIGPRHRAYP